jgi:uncharacterized protein (DUF1697 family)
MPATHVALLRGINVGTAKRVAMAELRALVQDLGYSNVRTLLNSGNVVFGSPTSKRADPAPRIQKALAARLGVESRVTVVTAGELDVAIRDNPLLKIATHPSRLLVGVLADRDDRARLEDIARKRWGAERLALGERVCYLWCPEGISKSRAVVAVEKELGDGITSRNWSTVLRLQELLREEA